MKQLGCISGKGLLGSKDRLFWDVKHRCQVTQLHLWICMVLLLMPQLLCDPGDLISCLLLHMSHYRDLLHLFTQLLSMLQLQLPPPDLAGLLHAADSSVHANYQILLQLYFCNF